MAVVYQSEGLLLEPAVCKNQLLNTTVQRKCLWNITTTKKTRPTTERTQKVFTNCQKETENYGTHLSKRGGDTIFRCCFYIVDLCVSRSSPVQNINWHHTHHIQEAKACWAARTTFVFKAGPEHSTWTLFSLQGRVTSNKEKPSSF